MTKEYKLFIDGKWEDAASGETFESINPADGSVNAVVAKAGPEDVDRAVQAARRAFESGPWQEMAPSDRGRLLYKAAQELWGRIDELAEIESRDNGVPINENKFIAMPAMVDVLEFYAGLSNKVQGETLAAPANRFNFTLKEPLGVVGAIVPWNFPLMISMWKIAPALAAGNTIVIKPSEFTPTSLLEMVKIFQEAGVPDGVINVVPGYGSDAGNALAAHKDVDKVTFTGSTITGKLVMQAAAQSNLKQVGLELGGKNPNIIFDDANIENAVNGSMLGIYLAQGQVCASGSRMFVQDSVYDDFMDAFVKKAQSIRVGDPLDPATQMGPQVSQPQLEKIESLVASGVEEGGNILIGGERDASSNGYFYTPTIIENVTNDMRIAREEIFGPVLSVIRFKDEDEVLNIANDTLYGLTAGVWTENLKRAHKMVRGLNAGTIYVNTMSMLDSNAPFGGVKQSGFGKDLGIDALNMYTQTKSVWMEMADAHLDWYGM